MKWVWAVPYIVGLLLGLQHFPRLFLGRIFPNVVIVQVYAVYKENAQLLELRKVMFTRESSSAENVRFYSWKSSTCH